MLAQRKTPGAERPPRGQDSTKHGYREFTRSGNPQYHLLILPTDITI